MSTPETTPTTAPEPSLPTDIASTGKARILFVCLGNICRSPAAEGILRSIVEERGNPAMWEIDSAGTGNYHIGQLPDQRMRIHARRRGIELTHRCRQVKAADFDRFDMIIPMDHSNRDRLMDIAPSPEAQRKIVPMSAFLTTPPVYDHIPDPYYEGASGFELVLDLLTEGCNVLYDKVAATLDRN
ncbi:MAG: low molecular weight phosphotyrosine protein phosphatase [Muribaculaceae bacterium]|nr:low molecular weight phosphotyrosine protein phosphatase [Muribaculaceae bacterium]